MNKLYTNSTAFMNASNLKHIKCYICRLTLSGAGHFHCEIVEMTERHLNLCTNLFKK